MRLPTSPPMREQGSSERVVLNRRTSARVVRPAHQEEAHRARLDPASGKDTRKAERHRRPTQVLRLADTQEARHRHKPLTQVLRLADTQEVADKDSLEERRRLRVVDHSPEVLRAAGRNREAHRADSLEERRVGSPEAHRRDSPGVVRMGNPEEHRRTRHPAEGSPEASDTGNQETRAEEPRAVARKRRPRRLDRSRRPLVRGVRTARSSGTFRRLLQPSRC